MYSRSDGEGKFPKVFNTLLYRLFLSSVGERYTYQNRRRIYSWKRDLNSSMLESFVYGRSNGIFPFSLASLYYKSERIDQMKDVDNRSSPSGFIYGMSSLQSMIRSCMPDLGFVGVTPVSTSLDSNNNNKKTDHIYLMGADPPSSPSSSTSGKDSNADAERKREKGVFVTLLMSGSSAMIGATTVFPIDKVKTRLQSSRKKQPNIAKALVRMLGSIFRKEGFRGLYRGLLPQLVGITPEKALKLTVNDFLRRFIRDRSPDKSLNFTGELLAGIGTGCIQISITNPYEVVKIRMQMQKPGDEKKGIIRLIRELGFRGLYRGLPATFFRDVPFNALYFTSYAFFRNHLAGEDGSVGIKEHILGASGAGILAAALDTPADTIKTRLQSGKYNYTGFWNALTTILREEGASALLKGMLPRVLIISPLFAITFASFEVMKRIF
eukprot:TRINITY_DN12047_c0_g1_i1.p1 TRINITY_DN12047_c0_g1~~TRINITY_DN12047_c0_g1_i1.p1  ORF type:complete len:438 (-),score=49.61 TRINITY_DN12047_c0_g1_i1:14-1327(-)